jgi:hypothetical protein
MLLGVLLLVVVVEVVLHVPRMILTIHSPAALENVTVYFVFMASTRFSL